jgi:hypothetical protein
MAVGFKQPSLRDKYRLRAAIEQDATPKDHPMCVSIVAP